MSAATMEEVTRLYDTQRTTQLHLLRTQYEPFRQFSLQLQKLLQSLHPVSDSEVVRPSLRILKRYRFDMCAAPIGFGNPAVVSADLLERLDAFAEKYQSDYPRHYERFTDLVEEVRQLVETDGNPLFTEIANELSSSSDVAVLLKEPRHIKAFEEMLITKGLDQRIRVLSQHQLKRSNACYEKLFLVGAASWFPEFVFRSPRALGTYVVTYSWLAGRLSAPKPAFDGWEKIRRSYRYPSSSVTVVQSPEPPKSSGHQSDAVELSPDDVVPQISLPEIMTEASRSAAGHNDEQVVVTARLCRLEEGKGVFIEEREGARSLVIDLEEEDRSKVKRVGAAQLRAGMFLILRSDEDDETDYIVPLANGILGARADGLRKFQASWKKKLREAVRFRGMSVVIGSLTSKGSIRANDVNVSNWMSERSIRTEDRRDFNAIMDLIGLLSEADKCWQFSGEIDRAHRRAGRLVRKQLMRLVNNIDLTELERLGRMRFELAEIGARPLLAVRVLEISHGNISISQSRLHRPFDLPE